MPRLALLLTTFIWGATFPATKAALEQMPPLSFLSLRFLLGTLLIVGWFLTTGYGLRRQQGILTAGAVATVFLFLGYALQTVGTALARAGRIHAKTFGVAGGQRSWIPRPSGSVKDG